MTTTPSEAAAQAAHEAPTREAAAALEAYKPKDQ